MIPGSGRSTGDGIGYPLQYSGLENSVDCIVHEVAKRRTRLSNFHSLSVTQPLLTDSATELVERGKKPSQHHHTIIDESPLNHNLCTDIQLAQL